MIRVLLVDKQKNVRETLKSVLEAAADFDIVGMSNNGREAIELVKKLQPDVVIMDIEMPGMDGVLATKMIAQSALGEKVKVLVVSSHDDSEYVVKSMQAGAKGYLFKGSSAAEIQDTVRSVHWGQPTTSPDQVMAPEMFQPITTDLEEEDRETDFKTSATETTRTGFSNQSDDPPENLTFEDDELHASEMLIDVETISMPISEQTRSRRSWKVPAILLGIGGALGGLYALRPYLSPVLAPTFTAGQANSSIPVVFNQPFAGKIEPAQVVPVAATASGLVQNVKVKVGQQVRIGESLLTISGVDDPKDSAQRPNSASAQTAIAQKQQSLTQQQQSAQQRIVSLQKEISNNKQSINSLRTEIANGPSQIARIQQPPNQPAQIQQQKEMMKTAQINYQSRQSIYQRKQKFAESQVGIASDRAEQLNAEAESARAEMEYARSNYENAQAALQETKQQPTDLPSLTPPGFSVQLQLDQEEKLRSLQAELRQEQLTYKQLTSNLQVLAQQSNTAPKPRVSTIAMPQPVVVDIIANKSGYVVNLLVQNGTKILNNNKMMGIAYGLKVVTQVKQPLLPHLKVGTKSIVQMPDGQKIMGEVVAITPLPDQRQQKVEVGLKPTKNVLIGQPANIFFPAK